LLEREDVEIPRSRERTKKADDCFIHQVVDHSTYKSTLAQDADTQLLRPGSVRLDPASNHTTHLEDLPRIGIRILRSIQEQDAGTKTNHIKQSTGARRPSAERPPDPAACVRSGRSQGSSSTVSALECLRVPVVSARSVLHRRPRRRGSADDG